MNFKLFFRNLINSGKHGILNIIGLALGMACALVIAEKVKYELSYDKHLPDSERIYRLTFETTIAGNTLHFARCWEQWISQLPGRFPQIEELVRLAPFRHTAVKAGDNKFYSDRIFATDSNFFRLFRPGIVEGDMEKALSEPYSAVITTSLANRYFGSTDPVGKTIMISGEYDQNMVPYSIKGVIKDSPDNSHVHFDILTSFVKPRESPPWAYVYLLLMPGSNPDELENGFKSFIDEVEPDNDRIEFKPHLQKITDIHLRSDKDREIEPNSSITNIYLYIIIAVVLIIISWVNTFNLEKARLFSLQKQTDIRRIFGAGRFNIALQAVSGSAVISIIALVLALLMSGAAGSLSHSFLGYGLFPREFGEMIRLWPFILLLLVLFVAASSFPLIIDLFVRPALIRSSDRNARSSSGKVSAYGILMAVQFFLATGLIVSAIAFYRQKDLVLEGSLGKPDREILVFKRQNWEIRSKYRAFRDKSLQNPLVINFTASLEEPSGETLDAMGVESVALDDDHRNTQLYVLSVEDNFLDFFAIPLIAGSSFRKYDPERKGEDYILNETAVKMLGWTPEEAIGKPFKLSFSVPDIFFGGTIVGVTRDFHFNTLRQKIKPYVLFQKPIFYLCFLVEVDKARRNEAIGYLHSIWDQELPDYPFQFEFLNDLYRSAYMKEFNQAKLTSVFSVLSIILICMGLYSVTSLLVIRRTKEIGIRKVNGATVQEIILMVSGEFLVWFILAFATACPAAWLITNKWLQGFAYRISISWWFFAVAGALVFGVSFITIAARTRTSAVINPVDSLRYE